MPEAQETTGSQEIAEVLPDQITRQFLVVKGRSGLSKIDLDKGVLANLERSGHGPDDYASIIQGHANSTLYGTGSRILGIHEEVRKRRNITVDGNKVEFVEAKPRVKNVWIGEFVRLLTPEEAAETPYAGRTALDWAKQYDETPEMVVKANDGYFYSATRNDVVIKQQVKQ